MLAGKTKIFQLPVNLPKTGAVTLTLFVVKFTDVEPLTEWLLILCKGQWDAPMPNEDRIAFVRLEYNPSFWGTKDPYAYVATQAAALNAQLTIFFGGAVPTTIIEKIEEALLKLTLFLSENVPQVK